MTTTADAEPWQLTADQFDLARHNGCITIRNPATGGHRTFRIETDRSENEVFRGKRIVSVIVGPDNEADYVGFGFVTTDGHIQVWRRFRAPAGGMKTDYEKFADMLARPEAYSRRGLEYICEAHCRKCNLKLTTPESVARGLGPTCAKQ